MASDLEKRNLEAHVDICAERYKALEDKLNALDDRMGTVEEHVVAIRSSLAKIENKGSSQLITIGTTIIGVLITAMIVLLVNFINK